MSASNKPWWMLAGLALVVAGIVFATRHLKRDAAPPAEISTSPTANQPQSTPTTQTHIPTILRAKPITENESPTSPRYSKYDPAATNSQPDSFDSFLPFSEAPGAAYQPTGPGSRPLPSTQEPPVRSTVNEPGETLSPAFRQSPAVGQGANPTSANPVPGSPVPAGDQAATSGDQAVPSTDAAVPPASAPTTYITIADDSFWNISKRQYNGEGRFFKALYYHNRTRIERPDKIRAGIAIDTPPLAELKRLYPDLCGVGRRR